MFNHPGAVEDPVYVCESFERVCLVGSGARGSNVATWGTALERVGNRE